MNRIIHDKEEFTKLVIDGLTIPELMKYYNCTRSTISAAKRYYDLVGKTPNSRKLNLVEGTKHCLVCNNTKSLNDFYSNGYTPKGTKKYKPTCKDCENQVRRKLLISRLLSLLKDLGKEYRCLDCGITGEYGLLDFHHRDPTSKIFDIGQTTTTTYSEDTFNTKMRDEILKCDILCPTCHRKRHLLRGRLDSTA